MVYKRGYSYIKFEDEICFRFHVKINIGCEKNKGQVNWSSTFVFHNFTWKIEKMRDKAAFSNDNKLF